LPFSYTSLLSLSVSLFIRRSPPPLPSHPLFCEVPLKTKLIDPAGGSQKSMQCSFLLTPFCLSFISFPLPYFALCLSIFHFVFSREPPCLEARGKEREMDRKRQKTDRQFALLCVAHAPRRCADLSASMSCLPVCRFVHLHLRRVGVSLSLPVSLFSCSV